MKKEDVKYTILLLVCLLLAMMLLISCTKKDDNTPPPCYECYHKAYLDSLTLVAQPRYFRCDDNIEAYEAKHTGWENNYYMVMECER